MKIQKITKNNCVITNSRFHILSPAQNTLLAYAMTKAHRSQQHRITVSVDEIRPNPDDRSFARLIRQSLSNLLNLTIEVQAHGVWHKYNLLTGVAVLNSSEFQIAFNPDLEDYYMKFDREFTSYSLLNIMNFRRHHSFKIYDICRQYLRIGKRKMTLQGLRTLTMTENKYPQYKEFKRCVLTPAIEEINEKTDITVTTVERRKGHSVHDIEFNIKPKPQTKIVADKTVLPKTLHTQTAEYGTALRPSSHGHTTDRQTAQGHSSDIQTADMQEMKAWAKERYSKKQGINNPGAYIATGLKHGWLQEEWKEAQSKKARPAEPNSQQASKLQQEEDIRRHIAGWDTERKHIMAKYDVADLIPGTHEQTIKDGGAKGALLNAKKEQAIITLNNQDGLTLQQGLAGHIARKAKTSV
ncbi:hypothetical protein FUAX_55220 (plasmid) [Fulvitalea axinellae]|uniref:Initiator Rep protein WH1 domain-containing protein n=1 Tax=Fulvitalea axinellae TaxID=1182444 RepID=A0AAU9DPD1_9BACT|nr:hypothetical protein FUAX_55220 [Fulvitalea axinellae]